MDDSACRILVVDDDRDAASATVALADRLRANAVAVHTLAEARRAAADGRYDLFLMDPNLPDGSGFDLLPEIDLSNGPVAIVTADPSIEGAARAVRASVLDYLVKPVHVDHFSALLRRVAHQPPREAGRQDHCGGLVGTTPAMHEVFRQIRLVAPTEATVLICGESGTGKELAAAALHSLSGRPGRFVAVNCGAVAPELLASQLFGHEKGSFTGALRRHEGFFEQAEGGTLFLDEITEMPLPLQANLLRVLESRSLTRVGGEREQRVDVRVVAATNRPPEQAIAQGCLRTDLYYRLADFPLELPALRHHLGDVPVLAQLFLDALNEKYGSAKRFEPSLRARLGRYHWPGNVRELRNLVQQAYILAEDELVRPQLPQWQRRGALAESDLSVTFAVGTPMLDVEQCMLAKTLAHFGNDKAKTAQALGISVKTVYNWLARGGER
jgi:DNA-binding NtrC family response regulator